MQSSSSTANVSEESPPVRASSIRSRKGSTTGAIRSRLSMSLKRKPVQREDIDGLGEDEDDDMQANDKQLPHPPSSPRVRDDRSNSSDRATDGGQNDSSLKHTRSPSVSKKGAAPPVPRKSGESSGNAPSSLPDIENPLRAEIRTIFRTFAGSIVLAIVVTRFVHWSLGLLVAAVPAYILRTQLQIAADDSEWTKAELHRQRQQQKDEQNSESVEWMNAVLKTVWPLINQDYFVPFIDLVEDALMQQVPGIVHGCRVEDLDQGTVPLHIQSFTLLPDSEAAFIDGADAEQIQRLDAGMESGGEVMKHAEDGEERGDIPFDVGEFVNLEVTFAYRSPAARKKKAKSNKTEGVLTEAQRDAIADAFESELPVDQIHMLIYMAIGLQKIAAVEVPVWCEVLGIEGKVRVRMQLVPTAPFVAHVAFTLVGKPKLEISAKPLGRRMVIDAMHLPIISTYVLHSVESVMKDFVSPHSYTIDVASLLEAQDGPRNVYALGVVAIVIHRGIDLPAADNTGNSDPFVSISFARAGKPVFTTRVLLKNRNPIYNEVAFLPVSADEVRDDERLRMTVFDADRFSVDDPLGKVEVSLDRLIKRTLQYECQPRKPSLLEMQTSPLQGMRKGEKVEGKLQFSIGFFRLSKPTNGDRSAGKNNMLQQAANRHKEEPVDSSQETKEEANSPPDESDTAATSDQAADTAVSDDLLRAYATRFDRFVHSLGFPLDDKVMQRRKERKERVKKLTSMMEGEAKATFGPPSKDWKAGILAFHIHSIQGLGFENPQRSLSKSKHLAAKPQYKADEDALQDSTSKMPNSYVQVLLNDEAIYRTRTKTFNPSPFYNAGGERFVANFDTSRIDFVVRDSRLRENDPILGVVGLKLTDQIVNTCRVTRWHTLTGGLGYGKIRITLLWRSCELDIPAQLSGWNVGVVEVAQCTVSGLTSSHKAISEGRDLRLTFETVGGRAETELSAPREEKTSHRQGFTDIDDTEPDFQWSTDKPIRIAVRQRYPNFVYVDLRGDSRIPGRSHRVAHAVIAMSRLADNVLHRRRIPLFESSDWQALEQEAMRDLVKEEEDQAASSTETQARPRAPVLEELTHDESKDGDHPTAHTVTISHKVRHDASLTPIGYLDIALIFLPGIAPEHRTLVAGDIELRAAFENFQTMVDCGQRPRPKRLSNAFKARVAAGTAAPSSTTDRDMVEVSREDVPVDDEHLEHHDGEDDEGDEGEDDNQGGALTEDDDGMVEDDTPEGRRARVRNLHRQQRGAAQVKSYRTLQWLKTNAEDGMVRVKKIASKQQDKRVAKMESEGVSHF